MLWKNVNLDVEFYKYIVAGIFVLINLAMRLEHTKLQHTTSNGMYCLFVTSMSGDNRKRHT